jgi:hypothetical protein
MDINKNYNKNRVAINYKYDVIQKEMIEGIDLSSILYEITGYMDEKRFGVTERQNIVCLDNNSNFRKLIQHIINDVEENTFETKNTVTKLITVDYNLNTKINTKNKKTHNKKTKRQKDKKTKKQIDKKYEKNKNKNKKMPNFDSYFIDSSYSDPFNFKTYICYCGNKCICNHCGSDCNCAEFHYSTECSSKDLNCNMCYPKRNYRILRNILEQYWYDF